MTCIPRDPKLSEIESVLAVERELVPQRDDFRQRVVERARASVQRQMQAPFGARAPGPRRVSVGAAAAAAVVLSALCAAAFYSGYRIRNRNVESLAKVHLAERSVVVQQSPMPSVVVALIPVASSASRLSTHSEAVRGAQRVGKANPSDLAKSVIDLESYTRELRVLQPARQAVARQDYVSALAAITEHHRLFPAGRLAEEREALRVKALLGLGRTTEAQRAGSAFRARFPRSALLGRIQEMLGS
jgi:hypothetical protein